MIFTKNINKNTLITSIGIISSLIGIGTFLVSLFYSVQNQIQNEVKVDREFSSSLLLAIHELSSNLTHLKSIKNFTIHPNLMTPIIRLQYKDTLFFYTKSFDIVANDAYGEEDNLIPLITKYKNGARHTFSGVRLTKIKFIEELNHYPD